jgi:hypothetical protein
VILLVLVTAAVLSASLPLTEATDELANSANCPGHAGETYLLAGGLNGTWFRTAQWAKLSQIYLSSHFVTKLTVNPQPGDLWSGAWNGSQWLISGAGGAITGTNTSDPFIYLYDGCNHIVAGTQYLWGPQASWHGGDVFASSYNGSQWLLSGLGSDYLPGHQSRTNHMALGTFDGYNFTDLSGNVPNQRDYILYANAWNGEYWLVGGGYRTRGVLFTYDGHKITNVSNELKSAVPDSGSVQRIAWNGDYWLVGGIDFLAKYDGKTFTDLTPLLNDVLEARYALSTACCNAVSALAWNGETWIIGGGAPIAVLGQNTAWLATYNATGFADISITLPTYISNPTHNSSILAISYTSSSWILGGYANGRGILLSYANGATTDMTNLVGDDMSTVNFVGVGSNPPASITEYALPSLIAAGSVILALVVFRRKPAHAKA